MKHTRPEMNLGAFVATLALASLSAAPAFAEAKTIEVEGVAAIVDNDIGLARDKAIDDAKRKAVEQVAGSHVSAETITENFQLVSDRIYARASGFVKTYQIKSQYKDDGTYVVKIVATVDAAAVAENLDQLFAVKPRVIVMIAEQNVGAGNYSYWWGAKGFSSEMDIMQTQLIKQWQPKGFKFVDPAVLKGKLRVKRALRKAALGNDHVVLIGRDADADIAIVGKVTVTDAGPVMDGVKMRSFHAVGAFRVLNISTGEIITVADDTAVAPHIDGNQGGRLAIKALADKIGANLQSSILSKWTAEAAGAPELEVVLKGKLKSKQIAAVRKHLTSRIRGVESAKLRRRAKRRAFLMVRYRGTGVDLGRAVEEAKFNGFSLEVEASTKKRLVLEVVR